jgi:hypothetical protein
LIDHFFEPFALPFKLPFALKAFSFSVLVRVGNSGSTTSLRTSSGVLQKNMAPSLPTEIIVF